MAKKARYVYFAADFFFAAFGQVSRQQPKTNKSKKVPHLLAYLASVSLDVKHFLQGMTPESVLWSLNLQKLQIFKN